MTIILFFCEGTLTLSARNEKRTEREKHAIYCYQVEENRTWTRFAIVKDL